MTQFDSNTFEHDYILAVLQHMITTLKTAKPVSQTLDKYAVELTAFMNGQIRSAVKAATNECKGVKMENQHQLIKGYRDLSEPEIAEMNRIKAAGESIGALVASVAAMPGVDQRWVAIARTELQQGFMALTRAVARPESF